VVAFELAASDRVLDPGRLSLAVGIFARESGFEPVNSCPVALVPVRSVSIQI